jgi:F-type H+-transporting ATPase subunit epsilon
MQTSSSQIQVDIADVARLIFSGSCFKVTAPAAFGEVCILPRHAPLLTSLRPGSIRLRPSMGADHFYYVSGGFMEVKDSHVTILADQVLRSTEIDQDRASEARREAERVLHETHLVQDRDVAKLNLIKAAAQLRVLQHAEIHRLKKDPR